MAWEKGQRVPSGIRFIVIPFWIEAILGRKSTNKTKSPLGLRWGFGHHILWSFINHKSGYKSRMTYRMARHWSNSNIFRSSNRRWIRFAASLKILLNAFSWWLWYTLKLLVSCCKGLIKSKGSHHCNLIGAENVSLWESQSVLEKKKLKPLLPLIGHLS